jgi:site-specific DNA-methyltransferase (adenine-specific)
MPKTTQPNNCYNKGQPIAKVPPTVAPIIKSSSEVKSKFTLLKGDCLEKMKAMPDKSIDLIICDLPFGCLTNQSGESRGFARDSHKGTSLEKKLANQSGSGCAWDIKIDLEVFWREVKRIRRDDHTPTLMFTTTKYGYELIESNPKEFRYDLVWDKQRGVSFLSANKMPMRSHEMVYVFSKAGANYNRIDIEVEGAKECRQFGKAKVGGVYGLIRENEVVRPVGTITSKEGIRCVLSVIKSDKGMVNCNTYNQGKPIQRTNYTTDNKRCPLSVINNINTTGKGKHPTEKPIELYKFLIERYSSEGDEVFDPTFGSCNSGFACRQLNRSYIGCEKDTSFFWKATNKLLTLDGANIPK